MKHLNTLRELAKFTTGLVVGDFLCGAWLYFANLLPMDFLGLSITPEIAIVGMLFDFILILLLIYYGWHINIISPSIHQKTLLYIVGIVLSTVAILHLLRLIFGAEINIAGWEAPFWLSWIGTVATGYLGYTSLRFANHK
ncbi:MAG: hypothetical protein GWP15_02085 [Nitrospirae bacterium]|nr:hypothetical protein [Nitrospirota bacterium]